MYNANMIAWYIIDKCFKEGKPVTNLRLQKLLYFVQGKSYIDMNRPMFNDDMHAWQFGPVVPNVYFEFCGYASAPIRREYINISSQIGPKDKELIDYIIEMFKSVSDWGLVSLSHEDGSPWNDHINDRSIISKKEIKKYFCELCGKNG